MTTNELLTAGEAAHALRISTRTLVRWREQGLVEAVRLPSGRYRYHRAEIDRILADGAKVVEAND